MTPGDPIEAEAVAMWAMVYGNPFQTEDELRAAFWIQHPTFIDGWERLARSVAKVTTVQTLEHIYADLI